MPETVYIPGRGSWHRPQSSTFVRSCWECTRCAFLTSVCAHGSSKGILATLNSSGLGLHMLRVHFTMCSHLL